MDKDWTKPTELDDVDVAFPAHAMDFMPTREEADKGLDALSPENRRKWIDFQSRWFFRGLPATTEILVKEGIDPKVALRHLGAIQGSFAPKHEHKESAVAYLASQWFNDVEYGDG